MRVLLGWNRENKLKDSEAEHCIHHIDVVRDVIPSAEKNHLIFHKRFTSFLCVLQLCVMRTEQGPGYSLRFGIMWSFNQLQNDSESTEPYIIKVWSRYPWIVYAGRILQCLFRCIIWVSIADILRGAHPYFWSRVFSFAADNSPRLIYHLTRSSFSRCRAMRCVTFCVNSEALSLRDIFFPRYPELKYCQTMVL